MNETPSPAPRLPRHVGIIMDGNGRWAARRGLPRVAGHRAGARAVRRVVEAAARMGLEQLTLYAFSTENWRRPPSEVSALMQLLAAYLRGEREYLLRNDVRLTAIGRLGELPGNVRGELSRSIAATRNCRGLTLCLALNYGGQAELVDACRGLVRDAVAGEVTAGELDAEDVRTRLYQPDMPPLDLVIRTGGDMRLSNFMLWQAAYAELYVTPVEWPDFNAERLQEALQSFGARQRRFGGIGAAPELPVAVAP